MDVKTPALDRLFEALSPALSAELDRVVQETKETMEQEFQYRLQMAAREAESAAASARQAEVQQAIDQAKEEMRGQVSAELEQQFNAKLEAATAQVRLDLSEERAKLAGLAAASTQQKDEWISERAKLQQEVTQWRALAELPDELSKASSQPEILMKFLRLSEPFAEGLAIYVTRKDGLALWKSRGNSVFPDIISQDTRDPESYFRTLSIRGRAVGAICAPPPFKIQSLDALATSLERAIEVFGIRLQGVAQRAAK
jgi:hypothetical protein